MTRVTKSSGIPWVGEIPVEWGTDEIRYAFKQVKSPNFREYENNLLSLSYGRIIKKDMESAFGLLPESFDTYNIIEASDIVLRLTDLQNDQKSLRVGFSEQRGIITSAYLTLRLRDKGHAKYFYYLIHAYDVQKVFYGMGAGVRQGLGWDELKRASVIIPSAMEQKAVADFLDEECGKIDGIIADMENQIEILQNYRKSTITEAVTKGLAKSTPTKPTGIDWIGNVPQHWEVCRIKDAISILTDYTANGSFESLANNVDYLDYESFARVVRLTDLRVNFDNAGVYVNEDAYNYLAKSALAGGEILVANVGAYAGLFWEMPQTDFRATLGPNMYLLKTNERCESRYLYYLGEAKNIQEQLIIKAISSAQPKLNKIDVKTIHIMLPPIDEQKAIIKYLDDKCSKADDIIADKRAAIDTMREYIKSLIYEYVTGKKRVKEAQ